MKIAVIGAGIAGLGAARALVDVSGHEVALFEANVAPGGHVYTVDVGGLAVDMGFIVCNRERYPQLFRMFGELGIETRPTTMSFSVSLPHLDLEWGSETLSALFADRKRLVDWRHWRLLAAVVNFLRVAQRDLDSERLGGCSLDEYLASMRLGSELRERFVLPLAAALWSLAPDRCGAFPAETYLRFLDQHGMLRVVKPMAWRTVVGGSRRYVDAVVSQFPPGMLRLGTPVTQVARDPRGVTLVADGREQRFDRVIIATHADTALSLLADASPEEQRVLGAFAYSANRTVLHRDARFLPKRPAAHAAWNYVADPDTTRVAVTYSMTRLQGLPDNPPYLVTLNPRSTPDRVLHEVTFRHPQFDRMALAAQAALPQLGTGHRTAYAGAHAGFGFHEDGLVSGLVAASRTIIDERGMPAMPESLVIR